MAASATRMLGKDISSCVLGGYTFTSIVQSVEINPSVEMVDCTVLKDPSKVNQANQNDFRMSVTLAYDTANGSDIAALIALKGTSMSYTVTASSGGLSYTGTATLSDVRHPISEGGQALTFDYVSDGS